MIRKIKLMLILIRAGHKNVSKYSQDYAQNGFIGIYDK